MKINMMTSRLEIKKRIFLAIPLTKDFCEMFAQYRTFFASKKGIRWIPRENLHITVCFLGYVLESDLGKIIRKMENIFSKTKPFDLEFNQITLAPPGKLFSMIWAEFLSNEEYEKIDAALQKNLREFLAKRPLKRQIIPHVTLARFEKPIKKILNLPEIMLKNHLLRVSSCSLMESRLSKTGAEYSVIKTFSF